MTIALTGAMGCGKSAAAQVFGELGANVVDSDALAHRALDSNPEVVAAVIDLLGARAYGKDGKADRQFIARRVFAPDARRLGESLEIILHPVIRRMWKAEAAKAQARKEGIAAVTLVEVPLLFEKRLEGDFDLCITVFCSEGVRISRLVNRGMSPLQISARDALQLPSQKKVELSDAALFNEGDRFFLKKQAEILLSRL